LRAKSFGDAPLERQRVLSRSDILEACKFRLDEIAGYPRNLDKAGAPIVFAERRARNGIFRRGDRRLKKT